MTCGFTGVAAADDKGGLAAVGVAVEIGGLVAGIAVAEAGVGEATVIGVGLGV